MEKQVLSKNPLLKDIFCNASFLYAQPLAISQVSFEQKSQLEKGILMLGDTAGLITPLCGNGMSMAMHSSFIAFRNISSYFNGKTTRSEMEQQYAAQWKDQFAARLMAGRTIQRLFGGNRSTAFFLQAMHYLPFVANRIISATHGKPF